jgi:hypothetical protein
VSTLAPIALFAFRRPWSTLQSLFALSRCPESGDSELTIYCDAPRSSKDQENVALVREIAHSRTWCGRTRVIERSANLGLARSIISGVGELCESHGRVIVLEDDLLVAKGFLAYMNAALERYADEPRVAQISGHQFPIGFPPGTSAFLPVTTSWGWGTWQRAWASFEEHPDISPLRSASVRWAFDQQGTYPYSGMLLDQMAGRGDSWAIRWNWSVFRSQKLILHPSCTLVRNIGFGGEATHTRRRTSTLMVDGWHPDAPPPALPASESVCIDEPWLDAWRTAVAGPIHIRVFRQARGLLPVVRAFVGGNQQTR